MNTSLKFLTVLAITAALAACGGGDAAPVAQAAAAPQAADPLDDLAANAAPNEAGTPPGDPFEAEFPAAAQVPDSAS